MIQDLPLARRDVIASRLAAGHSVNSIALAAEFQISEDAIRRDLRALAAAGLCRRVYGGALPLSPGATPLATRVTEDVERKRALARAAMPLLTPGSLVFLDNGSTNLLVAEELPQDYGVVVATSSIEIAGVLAARRDIDILMVGGQIDSVIGGSVDGIALEAVARLNIDTCFLGACAVSADDGVSAFDTADATFKRALLARSRKALVLATVDKLGRQAPHRIAAVDALSHIVIEHDGPSDVERDLVAAGATIVRASA